MSPKKKAKKRAPINATEVMEKHIETTTKMGAPTKYKPEYCQGIIDFFLKPLLMKNPQLPFFSAYAREIQVNTDTLQEWKKVYPDFSVSYRECKQIQEEILARFTLEGKFQPSFAIFASKNILGWRDVKEIKQEIKTEHDISPALADMFNKIYKKET